MTKTEIKKMVKDNILPGEKLVDVEITEDEVFGTVVYAVTISKYHNVWRYMFYLKGNIFYMNLLSENVDTLSDGIKIRRE